MREAGSHRAGPLPDAADPDPEWTQYVAWLDRQIAAGRDRVPGTWSAQAWAPESADPDDAEPDDPEPDDPEPDDPEPDDPEPDDPEPWDPPGPSFAQDGDADLLPPGPLLAGLTERAAGEAGRLSDEELVGVLRASGRLVAREQYKQVILTAEFGRRRQAAFMDAAGRGVPVGCRPGGFPGEELAAELAITRIEAGHRIDDALDLTSRLPKTLAGMAAGLIDADRAGWIALYTRSLSPADAAYADEVLAAAAPELRTDQVTRRAAALEMRLNPEAVAARREHAKRAGQRVEARREASGNASLSGRELDTADVLASKAYIDALAIRLRRSGLVDGTLDRLRALVMTDLTQGRDPLDRIAPAPARAAGPSPAEPAEPDGPCPTPSGGPSVPPSAPPGGPAADPDPGRSGGPAPLPALITLLVPAGTLLGWSTAPAQAGPWGLLDPAEARNVVTAAAAHPRTRWCVTLTGPDGTALAHGCARGRHPDPTGGLGPQPPPQQLAELLRRLGPTLTPIARDSCDHGDAEDGYAPSRALRHLVRARTATCDAPGCQAPAASADLDHTRPWPTGPTEQCNLAPRCRTHHRAKQAPDWQAESVAPGITRWTLPSGRTHVTTPTVYDV